MWRWIHPHTRALETFHGYFGSWPASRKIMCAPPWVFNSFNVLFSVYYSTFIISTQHTVFVILVILYLLLICKVFCIFYSVLFFISFSIMFCVYISILSNKFNNTLGSTLSPLRNISLSLWIICESFIVFILCICY